MRALADVVALLLAVVVLAVLHAGIRGPPGAVQRCPNRCPARSGASSPARRSRCRPRPLGRARPAGPVSRLRRSRFTMVNAISATILPWSQVASELTAESQSCRPCLAAHGLSHPAGHGASNPRRSPGRRGPGGCAVVRSSPRATADRPPDRGSLVPWPSHAPGPPRTSPDGLPRALGTGRRGERSPGRGRPHPARRRWTAARAPRCAAVPAPVARLHRKHRDSGVTTTEQVFLRRELQPTPGIHNTVESPEIGASVATGLYVPVFIRHCRHPRGGCKRYPLHPGLRLALSCDDLCEARGRAPARKRPLQGTECFCRDSRRT